MEEEIFIDGQRFERVVIQRGGATAVYRGAGVYLRLGERERIAHDKALHRRMLSSGFPVAHLVGEGSLGTHAYYIEESLGDTRLGDAFAAEYLAHGAISEERFDEFMAIIERFARAQCTTVQQNISPKDFEQGIHLDLLIEELPEDAPAIRARFRRASEHLAAYPQVVTHGDFNPQNLYPAGVIDFEDSFVGPFGYDLVTALVHIEAFPDSPGYEYRARYRFSAAQRREYLERIDAIASAGGLPPFSSVLDDVAFCRGVWTAVRMHQWPKIQAFRYERLRSQFLL